jgi:hypothetical protein
LRCRFVWVNAELLGKAPRDLLADTEQPRGLAPLFDDVEPEEARVAEGAPQQFDVRELGARSA